LPGLAGAGTLLVSAGTAPWMFLRNGEGWKPMAVPKVEVLAKVKQIIAEQLGVDEDEVVSSASFVDDLGADSLDQVELIMALEEAYGLEISDDEAEKMHTVGDASSYIEKHAKVNK